MTVLLPYLESPLPKTVEVAESLISHAANNGNPREVYIKVLQGLSSLSWVPAVDEEEEDADEEDADEEEAAFSGDEEEEAVPDRKALKEDPALAARHALRKFNNLLKALETVHPRIATKFPSRFLTTELSTLLIAFTKAVEVVDNQAATETVERLLAFVTTIRPHLLQARRQSSIERPPLPPRVSTANVTLPSDQQDADALEDKLQARLIASFLSHVLSGYLLRTRRQATAKPSSPEHEGHTHAHPSFKGSEESEERGLELGWAGKYDQEVLRPNKSKVPGGNTLIDVEREARAAQSETKVLVDEIAFMTEKLGIRTQELFELCQVGAGKATFLNRVCTGYLPNYIQNPPRTMKTMIPIYLRLPQQQKCLCQRPAPYFSLPTDFLRVLARSSPFRCTPSTLRLQSPL